MDISNYRVLVALRHAAESVDEVSVFLARALEVNLRLQKQSAWDRILGYLGGTAATIVAAWTIGGEFLVPGFVLAGFLAVMFLRALVRLWQVEKQRKEVTLDHLSVKDYLRKATRDRLENGVSLAIQNRKAAARLLEALENSDEEEEAFLQSSVDFWGRRIQSFEDRICNESDDLWTDNEETRKQILSWIEIEFNARPVPGRDA